MSMELQEPISDLPSALYVEKRRLHEPYPFAKTKKQIDALPVYKENRTDQITTPTKENPDGR